MARRTVPTSQAARPTSPVHGCDASEVAPVVEPYDRAIGQPEIRDNEADAREQLAGVSMPMSALTRER